MKKSLRVVIGLVGLYVVFGCVAAASAQRVGGYKEIATDDAGAVAAAEFAVSEQAQKQNMTITLVSIEHAESQVVAGINYKLCLKVKVETEAEDADSTQSVTVVVYQNLQRKYSLTSWAEEECSGSQ